MESMINDADINRIKGATPYPTPSQIGFIGPTAGGNKIRAEFSALEIAEVRDFLSDMGDFNVKSSVSISNLITELSEGLSRSVICTSPYKSTSFDGSFWDSFLHPVIISNRPLPQSEAQYIGVQRHLYGDALDLEPHRHLRLGEVRQNPEQAEVILRHADCVMLDLSALRLGDNLGSKTSCMAGLMIEEMCKIAKYTGASAKLKTVIIHGYDQNLDEHQMMAKNVALLLYYILDGHSIWQREKQQSEQYQRYTVLPDHCNKELVFIEDQRSGRWWVELFSDGAEKEVKMACTRQDYEEACLNKISERITNLLALA